MWLCAAYLVVFMLQLYILFSQRNLHFKSFINQCVLPYESQKESTIILKS